MKQTTKIDIKNLVLKIDNNYDRNKFDMDDWQEYLDILCQDREFQKKAIGTAIIYLASGKYSTINNLLKENFDNNEDIRDNYKSLETLIKSVQLPNMLSGVIDMATGAGKSYVIFGIAHIAMTLGLVKRCVVLCPSPTIADGLTGKFQELITKQSLLNAIPKQYVQKAISIIDANSTIQENNICVENIHAVYENTGSSIKDSFTKTGADTLVLSDEVHHAYNSSKDKSIKKWKEFITDNTYCFLYHIGLTGTAYRDNDYFADVIYRYSLKEAMTERIVKNISYVAEDTNDGDFEKFQKIHQNHIVNKTKYSNITPISIIVTADISKAKGLKEDFVDFLVDTIQEDRKVAESKVLIVTSDKEHKKNVTILKNVDENTCGVEWIISVSMLTEGWDVKNVFQIVPWEDRAFNSKLLISQVLGRGLRIPFWATSQPSVTVFNHSSWSKNIKGIVDEILENEISFSSKVLSEGERSKYNFTVHNIDYTQEHREKFNDEYEKAETFNWNKPLDLVTQGTTISKSTDYIDAINSKIDTRYYEIKRETVTVDEIATQLVNQLISREREAKLRDIKTDITFGDGKTELEKLPSLDEIKDYIRCCMQNANITGDELTPINVGKINGKFNALLRKKRTSAGYERKANSLIEVSTQNMASSSMVFSKIKSGVTIFYSSNFGKEISSDDLAVFTVLNDELPGKQLKQINIYDFKTPLSVILADQEPERKFVELLLKKQMAQKITAWVKARNVGFYSFQYILKRGSDPKEFNPDFFIRVGDNIIVIETKSDNDVVRENYSKMVDAQKHFKLVNEMLEAKSNPIRYYFNMLSPNSYDDFSKKVIDDTYFNGFNSDIEVALRKQFPNKNNGDD
jgi:type III restriction enzyme